MIIAAVLFAIAAVGGVVMALMRLSGRELPPMALAIVHGLFAAAGLVTLLLVVFSPGVTLLPKIALLVFLAAAVGGFVMFGYHLKNRPLPIPFVLIHGAVAICAFVLLIVAILSRS
jgi:hypothetical protein